MSGGSWTSQLGSRFAAGCTLRRCRAAWPVSGCLAAAQGDEASIDAAEIILIVAFCFQVGNGKLGACSKGQMMTVHRRNLLLATLLLVFWGLAMLCAFWWFEGRYLRSFSNQVAVFEGDRLQLPVDMAGPGAIRVVHFWDSACPCNVGNQQHLADLISLYAPQGVTFHYVRKMGSHGELPSTLSSLQPLQVLAGSEHVPSSPAVAIWDRDGRLAYFGPYSEGVTCSSSNSFIEPILEALLAGRRVNTGNNMAVGCFCNWNG